ncbi:MAG: TetR/AcrR family transcriptional regulator [Ilumatobacter sp.]|uniref:TetR/AcrR family transcriptional regulator n=1 Tax=Ilumatobacter sp. TaxID=1967498 RepID=UPI003C7531C7
MQKARIERGTARTKLLDAAIDVIRAQGFSATSVDDLCVAAGVTKGAFFHHFDTKEALGVAAAQHWSDTTGAMFAAADYHSAATAVERVLSYVDLRRSLIGDVAATHTCLVGTMTQEVFDTSPSIRAACADSILGHAGTLEADIDAALSEVARADGVTAAGLAIHTQVVLQGAFVVSKAADDPGVVLDSLDHLRRYLLTVLDTDQTRETEPSQ